MEEHRPIEAESILRSAALAGDQSAWKKLFDGSFVPLRHFVAMKEGEATDDVIQETWIIAARKLEQFDPNRGPFLAWLQGIALRIGSQHRRRRSRLAASSLRFDPPAPDEQDTSDISQTLKQLPQPYARALEHRYLKGQSVAQVARILQTTYKGAESLLARAKTAFRDMYLKRRS
jgi:RNA polymerase sigma-70 factor, ECF subfamily